MKIFCIGFNKCGTTSLHELFKDMGLKSTHNATWWYWKDKDQFKNYDCFTDGYERYTNKLTFPNLENLENMFPDAKFILQTRDLDKWLISRLKHGVSQKISHRSGKAPFGSSRHIYTNGLNHRKLNNQTIMRWVMDRNYWYNNVYEYFKNKDNLLIVDISDHDISSKINNFLGLNSESVNLKKTNKTINNRLDKYDNTIKNKINTFLEKYISKEDHNTKSICKIIT